MSYELAEDRDHLDPALFSDDLMSPTLGLGMRRLPSSFDAAILRAAWAGLAPRPPVRGGSR